MYSAFCFCGTMDSDTPLGSTNLVAEIDLIELLAAENVEKARRV